MNAKISLTRFLLAAVIVSIPAVILSETSSRRNAWIYVGLILLSLSVYYKDQFASFVSYLRGVT